MGTCADSIGGCLAIIVIAICITIYHITKLKTSNVAGEIERLAELKNKGALTNEEFEKQKRKILGS